METPPPQDPIPPQETAAPQPTPQPVGYPSAPLGPTIRFDVIGQGKDDARSLTRGHLQGLDVAMHNEQGTLQYELKVPLAKTGDHPYAIRGSSLA